MKTNVIYLDHGATIYMEDGQIWYRSYWTDGHKDSTTHKVLTVEGACDYAIKRLEQLEKEKRDAEVTVKNLCHEIEKVRKYCV